MVGGGWSTPRLGRLIPRERPSTHCTGGSLGGRMRQISSPPPPLGFDPWTVQPVASLYTYYAIPATCLLYTSSFRKHAPSDCFLTKTWDAFLVSITRATLLYRSGSVFTSRFLWRWLYSGTTRWSSPLCRRKRDVSRIRREIRRGQWTAETHNRTGSGS